ncbi:hypothetical protein M427DRAFT_29123 [Gonapodya prolifera JEL478]|uniref:Uncharacterized protein n=1 Tax=Gonapodya prolifera (strain JEL478) TaxID=1344416 RepID=A0A139AR02_GONPJ|nr:hypothetical protein M427DRAFT_29123 [Gonapodya prolifera JEL478]|eukprot:KXS19142.1 hypothetical protein M427DRAFT_29123 [Gonapodya prolifera JEL478]
MSNEEEDIDIDSDSDGDIKQRIGVTRIRNVPVVVSGPPQSILASNNTTRGREDDSPSAIRRTSLEVKTRPDVGEESLLQSTALLDRSTTDASTIALIEAILAEDIAGSGGIAGRTRDAVAETRPPAEEVHEARAREVADREAAHLAQMKEWGWVEGVGNPYGTLAESGQYQEGMSGTAAKSQGKKPNPRQPKAVQARAKSKPKPRPVKPKPSQVAPSSQPARPAKRSRPAEHAVTQPSNPSQPAQRLNVVSKETVRLVKADGDELNEELEVDVDVELDDVDSTGDAHLDTVAASSGVQERDSLAAASTGGHGDPSRKPPPNPPSDPPLPVTPLTLPISNSSVPSDLTSPSNQKPPSKRKLSVPRAQPVQNPIALPNGRMEDDTPGSDISYHGNKQTKGETDSASEVSDAPTGEPTQTNSLAQASHGVARRKALPNEPLASVGDGNLYESVQGEVDRVKGHDVSTRRDKFGVTVESSDATTSVERSVSRDTSAPADATGNGEQSEKKANQMDSGLLENSDDRNVELKLEKKSDIDGNERDGGSDADGEEESDDLWDTPIQSTLIHPLEALHNPEFFLPPRSLKQAQKTPERYVRIRNHVLALWAECLGEYERTVSSATPAKLTSRVRPPPAGPRYLTKTRCRRGLKEGDVHAVSRVHRFLERCGAINRGALRRGEKKNLLPPKKRARPDPVVLGADLEGGDDRGLARYPARSRAPPGLWATSTARSGGGASDTDSSQGSTGSSLGMSDEDQRKLMVANARYFAPKEVEAALERFERRKRGKGGKKRKGGRRRRWKVDWAGASGVGYGDEDLALIEVSNYGRAGPFKVVVDVGVKLLIDLHAHLSHHETLGLLAGTFRPSTGDSPATLHLRLARPCRSLSSSPVHCEIDPLSELAARKEFAERDLEVVGWYHSHPTFEARPSGRDVATQGGYQALFRRGGCVTESGGSGGKDVEPFVGVIVSPRGGQGVGSKWGVFHVGLDQWIPGGAGRVPYSMGWEVVLDGFQEQPKDDEVRNHVVHATWDTVRKQMDDVVEEAKGDPHAVPLGPDQSEESSSPRLARVLDSLRADLVGLGEEYVEAIVGWVAGRLGGSAVQLGAESLKGGEQVAP